MWLRDWLPTELRGARAIIYGYDSELGNSESFQDMGELVLRFIQLLEAIAPSFYSDPSVSPQRVIVLFGHSMGGILLKHALIKMNHSGSPLQKVILGMIKEVVFFGVPNRGMQISHFRAMVEGNPNEKLVERLRENSPYLEEIDRLFFDVAMERRIRLISVFETLRSRSMRVRSSRLSPEQLGKVLTMSSKTWMAVGPRTDRVWCWSTRLLPFKRVLKSQINCLSTRITRIW